jgi:hypothetical protein
MAELAFKVDIDGKGFAKVTKLSNDFNKLDKNAKKSGDSMSKMGAIVAAGFLAKLGKDAVFAAAELENLELQFKPLLGSAEEAKKRIDELSKFAASTPFELPAIAKASKTLQTLTGGTLATGKGLKLVGDAAAVAGVGFDELSVHVGRAYSNLQANRAAGESISRLQELGLVSGQTRNEIEALQKAGRGVEAWELLQDQLKKTEGAMEGLSGTFTGKLSTLSDNWRLFTADFIEKSGVFDLAKGSVDALISSIDFLTNKELGSEFDKILDDLPELKKVIEDQEKQKEEAFKKEQKRLQEEATARANAIKNEKLNLDNAKKQSKARQDEELKEMDLFLKEIEEKDAEKAQTAIDNLFAIAELEDQVRLEHREKTLGEFAFLREQEIIEHELRLALLAGNNEALAQQEDLHTSRILDIKKREADAIAELEKQKQEAQLATFNVYGDIAQNTVATMQAAFGDNKALASAMIAIQGAQAVVNALTVTPFPLGLSMAVMAGAQTARSLATVNSTKAFALGGVVGGGEQMIRVNEQGTESVLNASATRSIGRETIDLLNNGRADMLTGGGNSKPQININVNGVLSREVFENEIKPHIEQEMAYR